LRNLLQFFSIFLYAHVNNAHNISGVHDNSLLNKLVRNWCPTGACACAKLMSGALL